MFKTSSLCSSLFCNIGFAVVVSVDMTSSSDDMTSSSDGMTSSSDSMTLSSDGMTLSSDGMTLSSEGMTLSSDGMTSSSSLSISWVDDNGNEIKLHRVTRTKFTCLKRQNFQLF